MPIVGIGTVVVDHVVELREYPEVDTKSEIISDWQQVGGPVAVALSTAAFYGSMATFCGRWGNDVRGQFVKSTLADRGIRLVCDAVEGDWATGFAQVWVDRSTGKRTIAYSRGRFPLPDESLIADVSFGSKTILHLDGWAADAAIAAAKIVQNHGGTVVLDAGSAKPGMNDLLPHLDVLIASKLFLQSQFGTDNVSVESLLQLGPPNVITTSGPDGAKWLTAESLVEERAINVDAVDTNGAGDIFTGAVLHALEAGLKKRQILKFANQVAGFSCGHRGNSTLPPISVDSVRNT